MLCRQLGGKRRNVARGTLIATLAILDARYAGPLPKA
jgi:hypothetical protein